jgi:2-polyprenyl-6-methoxyphenol hydroxylase-like FAD-dependent oxidoreductase
MKPDVLIAGAGPSGLSLAITLRRFGIPVRIIDRAAQPSAVSKALAVWSGSLEALQGMQVINEFVAAGKRLRALSVGDGSRTLAVLAVGDGIDSPYLIPSSCRSRGQSRSWPPGSRRSASRSSAASSWSV